MIGWLRLLINGDHARIEIALRDEHNERVCPMCGETFAGSGEVCERCELTLMPDVPITYEDDYPC